MADSPVFEIGNWTIPKGAFEITPPRFVSPAESMFGRIAKQIAEFESQLDDNEDVGARLVTSSNNLTFHILNLEYREPDLIIFHGTNEHNKPLQLLQHVTQINILLTALPKELEKPRRIGFGLLGEVGK
jgi:hypothetical protein